jgi:Tfp pilus assembly protein PilW
MHNLLTVLSNNISIVLLRLSAHQIKYSHNIITSTKTSNTRMLRHYAVNPIKSSKLIVTSNHQIKIISSNHRHRAISWCTHSSIYHATNLPREFSNINLNSFPIYIHTRMLYNFITSSSTTIHSCIHSHCNST